MVSAHMIEGVGLLLGGRKLAAGDGLRDHHLRGRRTGDGSPRQQPRAGVREDACLRDAPALKSWQYCCCRHHYVCETVRDWPISLKAGLRACLDTTQNGLKELCTAITIAPSGCASRPLPVLPPSARGGTRGSGSSRGRSSRARWSVGSARRPGRSTGARMNGEGYCNLPCHPIPLML